jgi:diaminopimelate decarboxylase
MTEKAEKYRITADEMSNTFRYALLYDNLINDNDTSIIFYDLAFISDRIDNIKKLFPSNTLHAIAVKANPLIKILSLIRKADVGLEVASLPELYLAEKVGFSPDKIVFDSPSKTKMELETALKLGVYINADSFEELDRIGEILKRLNSKSKIGVRVNPQVGRGSIISTSVADSISKFGIPINENIGKLKEYYLKYSWLNGMHVHIGSQGCPVSLIIEGINKVMELVEDINETLTKYSLNRRIDVFDIGGGLAVSYDEKIKPILMNEYKKLLQNKFPNLFTSQYKMITEFGRYFHANTGWAVSKVEYVKREINYSIIMTHLGADLFLRKCYNPNDWHHQITVLDRYGNIKTGIDKNKYIVAGPLCFAGDVIAKDLELPVVEEGDYILIHDVGAYTLSMWSRYNSRQIPKVIGYWNTNESFEVLKDRERKEDLFEFWK